MELTSTKNICVCVEPLTWSVLGALQAIKLNIFLILFYYSITQKSTLISGSYIRKELAMSIAESFKAPHFSVLHWDGKIIPNELRKKTNRLAIGIGGPPDHCQGQ